MDYSGGQVLLREPPLHPVHVANGSDLEKRRRPSMRDDSRPTCRIIVNRVHLRTGKDMNPRINSYGAVATHMFS